ncbi:MAG: bifunctional adenosylcobinamide kinase/adenosylcobinamide-phosphate guanylyltransferase [Aquabacterium sp.]|uniref:bifunctional adenosylcobinamide kinase/adenosylcobinamide-phosphate guanylyltransferase n=1 Tax=Aquabacterium sp. TaxID=1872578 RepID=UPI003BC2382A
MALSSHHLIVGGQRSGKSRQAERLARQWLSAPAPRRVTMVATAIAGDDEMRARIARHQSDRPEGVHTVECPLHLTKTLSEQAAPDHLLIVDCLTLWLTNWLMPMSGVVDREGWLRERGALLAALPGLASQVVFVSNEVGWGVSPISPDVRGFVDELGWLNQAVAQRCETLTLMVAGQPWSRPVQHEGAL